MLNDNDNAINDRNAPGTNAENPTSSGTKLIANYTAGSQFGFTVIAPLLIFIVGGSYAADYFHWIDAVRNGLIILGVVLMFCSLVAYTAQLIRYTARGVGRDLKGKTASDTVINPEHGAYKFKTDKRDNDYYADRPEDFRI